MPVSGFHEDLFGPLSDVEPWHFWFVTRRRLIAQLVSQECRRVGSSCKILEVGCGTGNVLAAIERDCTDNFVVGLDPFQKALQHARKRCACPLIQGDARSLPLQSCFDIVGMFDVLEHLEDDIAVLRSVSHVLRPRGLLIVTVPAWPCLWSSFDRLAHHQRRYLIGPLSKKLSRSGYTVDYATYFMSLLFPPTWLRRKLLQGIRQTTPLFSGSEIKEFSCPEPLNNFLSWLLSVERVLIHRKFRLPIGTSLLVLARKS